MLAQIQCPQRTAIILIDDLKFMCRIKLLAQIVLFRRQEPTLKVLLSCASALFNQERQDGSLDGPDDNSTAHEKGVNFADVIVIVGDRHTDNAIVTKTILDPNRINFPGRIIDHFGYLLLAVTSCRKIELIGFLRELRDSRKGPWGNRSDLHFLVQRAIKVFQRSGALFQFHSLALICIVASSFTILFREIQALKYRSLSQRFEQNPWDRREFDDGYFRQFGTDALPLDRIVVQKS